MIINETLTSNYISCIKSTPKSINYGAKFKWEEFLSGKSMNLKRSFSFELPAPSSCKMIGSTDQKSSQYLRTWFHLNIFHSKTCRVVCHSYCFCYIYSATHTARENVQKMFDLTFEMIQLEANQKTENTIQNL